MRCVLCLKHFCLWLQKGRSLALASILASLTTPPTSDLMLNSFTFKTVLTFTTIRLTQYYIPVSCNKGKVENCLRNEVKVYILFAKLYFHDNNFIIQQKGFCDLQVKLPPAFGLPYTDNEIPLSACLTSTTSELTFLLYELLMVSEWDSKREAVNRPTNF